MRARSARSRASQAAVRRRLGTVCHALPEKCGTAQARFKVRVLLTAAIGRIYASKHWINAHCGFGSHLEMRTLEFAEKLEDWQYCSWCGVVSSKMSVLPCRHVMCQLCIDTYKEYDHPSYKIMCCKTGSTNWTKLEDEHLSDKQVHCVNAGCDFVGRLKDLDEHLRQSCAMYSTTCSKDKDERKEDEQGTFQTLDPAGRRGCLGSPLFPPRSASERATICASLMKPTHCTKEDPEGSSVAEASVIGERAKFRRRQQVEEESIYDYVAELRKLPRTCDFGSALG
ncbi:hypothetical protein HPB52_008524 [Rhipicephalus sanguineus]|uniref:Uncharacterized protein n=1 Tax=Rhipicephalus sanguineus TaxID=34632 RepID=A0A9D4QCX4_RHISA|nr:hypothetical protein HPB52_008524 [Rhipicephalus sanguineus]